MNFGIGPADSDLAEVRPALLHEGRDGLPRRGFAQHAAEADEKS
jgi:hypothetical protein